MKVSMFSDESGMFQRMTPMPFNPDWISSPGDTIKDILEERNFSVESFKAKLLYLVDDWHFEDMDAYLEGELKITDQAAEAFVKLLGSTKEFWLKRDAEYWNSREKQPNYEESITPKISDEKYTEYILIDFLLQMDKGIAAKDCKVRFTKQDIEEYLNYE